MTIHAGRFGFSGARSHDVASDRHIGCGCRKCRMHRGFLEEPFEAGRRFGTPADALPLPGWQGWQGRLSLPRLLRLAHHLAQSRRGRSNADLDRTWRTVTGNSGPMPSTVRHFFRTGGLTLYRVGHEAKPSQAVYIGMAPSASPASRLVKHMSGDKRGSKVHAKIGSSPVRVLNGVLQIPSAMNAYVVHVGRVSPRPMAAGTPDYRMLHVYETLLQKRELPKAAYRKIARNWSFED
ncbi:hypothetical protein [uncultured Jannaschia sp.]|uniref:hypothetical protein n=1 Tax=uncultured Jannaschia sp. TaxID=293347 RepID=UPI00261E47C1|nr:hypothetical protein [uncultured Jannaschia sp.]